jgi:hypothetical protein
MNIRRSQTVLKSGAATQRCTQKHGNAKDDAQLQIHNTPPNQHQCCNPKKIR